MVKPFKLVGEMDTVGMRPSVMVHSDDSNSNTSDTVDAALTRKENEEEEDDEKGHSFMLVGLSVKGGEI